jgi:hypothetical protein
MALKLSARLASLARGAFVLYFYCMVPEEAPRQLRPSAGPQLNAHPLCGWFRIEAQ